MAWGVKTWQGTVGAFSRKSDAQDLARQMREANRQAGNKGAVRVVRVTERTNPTLKPGKWIKATAVRIRKEAGRLVMDIKR